MRQLSLHASALNEAEYDLFTSSIHDLALADDSDHLTSRHDDAYYDQIKLGVREARGWLRGRYSHVPAADIDTILRFFSPNLGRTDCLSGGQFFAAFRLVIHVENGKDLDRGLAFVQAHPVSLRREQAASDRRLQTDLPPPTPMRRNHTDITIPTPATSSQTSESQKPNPFFAPDTPSHPNSHPQPPLHPSQRHDIAKSQPITQSPHATHNPFINRTVKDVPNKDGNAPNKVPPLPPRKPPPPIPVQAYPILIPPPRHNSILLPSSGRKSVSPSRAISTPGSTTPVQVPAIGHTPFPPPKPSHVTSTLMKQSLQASKAAQTMKRAEEQLEKERVLQVLKSSSVVSGGYSLAGASVTGSSVVVGTNIRNRSSSPTKIVYAPSSANNSSTYGSNRSDERAPPLPRRREQQQQPSPPVSVSSLEEVALAAAHPPFRQPNQTPILSTTATAYDTPRSNPSQFVHSSSAPFRPLPDPVHNHNAIYESPNTSPSRPSMDLPHPTQPPTHPDRKPSYLSYQTSSTVFRSLDSQPNSNQDESGPFYGSSLSHGSTAGGSYSSPTRGTNTPEGSPTARVFRSKSLHHPSPPLPPIPPPLRRKRPESVQVLSSGEIIFGGSPTPMNVVNNGDARRPGSNLSRHTSMSSPMPSSHRRSSLSVSSTPSAHSQPAPQSHDSHPFPLSNIQRTLATLQPKLDALQFQPHLDKARYKAEAGISRRGFVKDGGGRSGSIGRSLGRGSVEGEEKEELISGSGDERGRGRMMHDYGPPGVDRGGPDLERDAVVDSDETGDSDWDGEGEREWRRTTKERWAGKEKDELKWPAGEGWNPL